MGSTHLRTRHQKALRLAQLFADHRDSGPLYLKSSQPFLAAYTTLCVRCGNDVQPGEEIVTAYFNRRPNVLRYVHNACPPTQLAVDELLIGQHSEVVMDTFVTQGRGRCAGCQRMFPTGEVRYRVRRPGGIPDTGEIDQYKCRECVSAFSI